MPPINVYEYERAAADVLPKMVYDYYAGGARDEITLHENRTAYDRIDLRYRVMRDIRTRSMATTVLGHEVDLPILIAPTAFHAMASENGELDTVRAAGTAGTIMTLSTLSTVAVEEVCAEATGPVWFQLYVQNDRDVTRALVERAESAGCSAIVLTADAQVWGVRERDEKNNFQLPEGMQMKNLVAARADGTFPKVEGSGLKAFVNRNFDENLTWDDLDWLAGLSDLPVLVKGIVRGDDARLAAEHGAAGVVVSNHGGRQLDTSPPTVEVLPEIAKALQGTGTELLVDGGIRRGTDVLKAIALGASAVCIGRAVLWGLAATGQSGVEHVFELLREELDLAMALCGARTVEEITPDLVRVAAG
jgi:4-hydroxymandelate oxidase